MPARLCDEPFQTLSSPETRLLPTTAPPLSVTATDVLRSPRSRAVAGLIWLGLASSASAAEGSPDVLLDSMVAELDRTMTALADEPTPPYWLSIGVLDEHSWTVGATHGAAGHPSSHHRRYGDIDLRVGSFELDNTHKIRDAGWFDGPERHQIKLPLEDDPTLLRHSIWLAMDDTYRGAARRLIKVRTNNAVKVEREDTSNDFSPAPAQVDLQEVRPLELDTEPWTDIVRRTSARFLDYPHVYDSNVTLDVEDQVQYLVTTDGTRLRHQRYRIRVSVWGSTVAEDGQVLGVYDYIDTSRIDGIPSEKDIAAMVDGVAQRITDLRDAPVVDPFTGPAILRGRAAAVFFHEILGHRAEGHRQKDEDEGQTLTDMVGQQIFPAFISVHDDPTIQRWDDLDLNGYYPYDDEGVKAERVTIIDHGVLDSFLMSRAPIEGTDHSNGHGRRQPGAAAVARQGNLIVSAEGGVPYEELREQLIERVKADDKPFGLIFDDISGGFTLTGRGTPNSYAVQPVTVWRVWPDGRPDELVRGVDLIGTPLVTFGRIVGASNDTAVFNGMCGAESGWVPVSGIAPDLLVSEVEVQRREKDNDRPPLLPPPMAEGRAPQAGVQQ